MLERILTLLPDPVIQMAPEMAMGIAAGGVVLGIFGARLSRSIIPLALVAAGTLIGRQLPHWFGWDVDRMGTAFGAAILLGLSGYLLSTVWEGILFGILLAAGAGVAVWLALLGDRPWHPTFDPSATAAKAVQQIWEYHAQYRVALPLAVGTGLGFALGLSLLASWPRLGRALFYSMLGMTMLLLGGAVGLRNSHPDWLNSIPGDFRVQVAIIVGMIIFATFLQWLITGERKKHKPDSIKPKKELDLEEEDEPIPAPVVKKKVIPPPPPKWATSRKPSDPPAPKKRDDRNDTGRILEM